MYFFSHLTCTYFVSRLSSYIHMFFYYHILHLGMCFISHDTFYIYVFCLTLYIYVFCPTSCIYVGILSHILHLLILFHILHLRTLSHILHLRTLFPQIPTATLRDSSPSRRSKCRWMICTDVEACPFSIKLM